MKSEKNSEDSIFDNIKAGVAGGSPSAVSNTSNCGKLQCKIQNTSLINSECSSTLYLI